MIITEEEILKKLFNKKKLKSIEAINFYYKKLKKIIVFIPEDSVDKVFKAMCKANAGNIGNYKSCSFRTKGEGTFFAKLNANPSVGNKGKLEYINEVKLEMECEENDLNDVINSMMEAHPYEEIAYEVYDFQRRTNRTNGIIINFRESIDLNELIYKVNPLYRLENLFKEKLNKIGLYVREYESKDSQELKSKKIKTAIFKTGKNYKIVKI